VIVLCTVRHLKVCYVVIDPLLDALFAIRCLNLGFWIEDPSTELGNTFFDGGEHLHRGRFVRGLAALSLSLSMLIHPR
jgi:hypothetical protein